MKSFINNYLIIFFILFKIEVFAQITCPDPSELTRIASSFHSTVIIDYQGNVKYWGQGASHLNNFNNALSPTVLPPSTYNNGTPITVAAGSMGTSSSNHQLFLLASTGLFGWGADNSGTIGNGSNGPIVQIPLPNSSVTENGINLEASDIAFIQASGGGIAVVTKLNNGIRTNGEVYVKNGATTGGATAYTYGDGSTGSSMNSSWHRVSTTASGNPTLNKVVKLSYSQKALMALTEDNEVYVWGERVYSGNFPATSYNNQSRADKINTLPAGITPIDVRIISRTTYTTSASSASQFILADNGKVYGVGEGNNGILGQDNQTDQDNWVAIKNSTNTGDLQNIIQIGTNSAYIYSSQYYSMAALDIDGNLYCWGENNYSMLGGDATRYLLPTIPPNFNVNLAKVGYFHMGGHTTAAFLRGSNRFCYIGHLIGGSMGDGSNSSGERREFDCINTPEDYLCAPPPPMGCAAPSANELAASSNHAMLLINGQPNVTYWGESASSAVAGGHVTEPTFLYEYNGIPRGVAAGATSDAVSQSTQMWILTTEGIWGWGISANTIRNSISNAVGMTYLELPIGINAEDINFIRSSRGGIAIVTNDGEVYIKAGSGSACHVSVYGDGSGSLNSNWHQVTTDATGNPSLTGVVELSFGGTCAMAITDSGQVYVWGLNTFLGDNNVAATRNRASLMTLHPDFSATVLPRTLEIEQQGNNGAAQFILATNGSVYSLGANNNGVLGLGAVGEQREWQKITSISNIKRIVTNNCFSNGNYSIAALTHGGTLYTWGNNQNGIIGAGANTNIDTPVQRLTNISNVEMGGFHTIAFSNTGVGFYYAGRVRNGSKADGTSNSDITTFTLSSANVPNCAGAVYTISGKLMHDANGMVDSLVNGTELNNPGGTLMYANLLDEMGYVVATTTIDSIGEYTFDPISTGNYTVQISAVPGTLYAPAPDENLHSQWRFTGAQIGNTTGQNIEPHYPNGRMQISLVSDITDANFGVSGPSVAAPSGIRTIQGNVFHDGNGIADGLVENNGSGIPNSGLNVSLVYPFGEDSNAVYATVPVANDGTYSFPDVPVGTWNVVLHTSLSGSHLPQLPAGWVSSGEQIGTTPNVEISETINSINQFGIIEDDAEVVDINFGIQQPPVAEPKEFTNIPLSAFSSTPPTGFSYIPNYYTLPMTSTELTGYSTGGSLSGTDPEDCPGGSACNSNTGSTFNIHSIQPNTKLFYNFGGTLGLQEIDPNLEPVVIPNFNASNMVIYGEAGNGTSSSGYFGFTYSITDSAGATSAAVPYTIETNEPLPLDILEFTGRAKNYTSVLNWTTTNEIDVTNFVVMRSADGFNWENIGSVKALNNYNDIVNSYSFTDKNPNTGTNFYRLGINNLDGTTAISKIVSVHHKQLENNISIAPNPTSGYLTVKFNKAINEAHITVQIIDISGAVVKSLHYHDGDVFVIDMNDLPAGSYVVNIYMGDESISQKIMKQ